MAAPPVAWGDEEYETDPEDAPLPSMRRREASDEEDGEPARTHCRAAVQSDADSDGQGGVQVYDDDDDEVEEEDELEDFYDEEEFEQDRDGGVVEVSPKEVLRSLESEGRGDGIEHGEGNRVDGEGKKENEPFTVPTSGAFYMHDDRFQDNARGRRRRIFGGRKLWDPKDESAWVHDRFEEMNLQDARYNENNRRSRGRFRGRNVGKNRGVHRGYGGGIGHYASNDDFNNQKQPSRPVKGRGPRRYEALPKSSSDVHASRQKLPPAKIWNPAIITASKKKTSQAAEMKMNHVVSQKHAFASTLNFDSPPFYPSGSTNLNQEMTQKRDTQAGNSNKGLSYSRDMGENSQIYQSSSLPRGKTVIDPVGHERFHVNESRHPGVGKPMGNTHLQPSGFSLAPDIAVNSSSFEATSNNQYVSSTNQFGRVSARIQSPVVAETPFQPVLRVSAQHFLQSSSVGNKMSSPSLPAPSLPSANSSEVGETDSPPGSNKSDTSLAGKGRSNSEGTFTYTGPHVLGSTGKMGLSQGDQNLPRTPALLPVVQFGGQLPGGVGVPAVGMAVPGYVAQQQLGFGNSEMTWVPVLAGVPGALGAACCPPYIALDRNYYARPSGQTLSASSKETSTNKPASHTSQSDTVVDEVGRRQTKPRRYSEMNFGQ